MTAFFLTYCLQRNSCFQSFRFLFLPRQFLIPTHDIKPVLLKLHVISFSFSETEYSIASFIQHVLLFFKTQIKCSLTVTSCLVTLAVVSCFFHDFTDHMSFMPVVISHLHINLNSHVSHKTEDCWKQQGYHFYFCNANNLHRYQQQMKCVQQPFTVH